MYRWWKRWFDSGRNLNALNNKPFGKEGYRKYKTKIQDMFYEVVNRIYLSKERQNKLEVYTALTYHIKQYNKTNNTSIEIPSRATIYRMLDDLDQYTVIAERHGIREAEKIYRTSGKGVMTQYPLERVEIDHTPLDVMVIDEIHQITLGRPYLTCVLDSHTRFPLALEIGFEPPSELSVVRALRQAIWPKTSLLENYPEITKDWSAYGIPMLLVCDNGLEFHSEQLRRMCGELNIELLFCPKHKPHYKGRVERFLGTLNRQVSQRLKGTTFSNIVERGDYNSAEEATITLKELKSIIYFWAVEIYAQSSHKSLGTTPYKQWMKGLGSIEPLLPASRDHFDLICAKEFKRKLSHEGIQFKHLFYNSETLRTMRILYGNRSEATIRVDVENLEQVWVYDKNSDSFMTIPSTDPEYTKELTLFQHEKILEIKRQQALSDENSEDLAKAKELLRQNIQKLGQDKRIKQRSRSARLGDLPPPMEKEGTASKRNTLNFVLDDIPNFEIHHREDHDYDE